MRRDDLRDGDKVKSYVKPRVDFIEGAVQLLTEIQAGLLCRGKGPAWTAASWRDVTDWPGVENYFAGNDEEFKRAGCASAGQSRPVRRWKRWMPG